MTNAIIVFRKTCHVYYNQNTQINITKQVWDFIQENEIDYTKISQDNYNLLNFFLLAQ